MVKLQIVKSAGTSERPLNKRRVCTVACCVDNAYGRCSSQPHSARICNEPCAKFVQVTSSCANHCCKCDCMAG
jgi:hypothetical protein